MRRSINRDRAPLKILLADTDYSDFLSLKQLLSAENGFHIEFLWCGERDQYHIAVRTGIYDLVLMDYCVESLQLLEQVLQEGGCVPVVLLADQASDTSTVRAARCGALGVLSRKCPEQHSLKYFLLCADHHH